MEDLTFGEQVKIILGRKGMTIKQLAELIEEKTGKKMSRQNLTQRLARDNFQEQDMRMIARILECSFHLSVISVDEQPQISTAALEKAAAATTETAKNRAAAVETEAVGSRAAAAETETVGSRAAAAETETVESRAAAAEAEAAESRAADEETEAAEKRADEAPAQPQDMVPGERDMTIGELYDMHRELTELEESVRAGEPLEQIRKELKNNISGAAAPASAIHSRGTDIETAPRAGFARKTDDVFEPVIPHNDVEEDAAAGELNPYTGREYQSNSVRMHPTRIGYVQVYDRAIHKWTDMTEWAFLGLQERKKALLGKAYEPPIYLD